MLYRPTIFKIIIISLLCSYAPGSQAQNWFKDLLQRMDSTRTLRLEMGKPLFTPFIAPSYTPETELMVSAGGLLSFKAQPKNDSLPRSTFTFSVGYSTNKALLVNARNTIYGHNDLYRLIGEVWVRRMPDHYWGVGYNKGRNVERSDSTTLYQRSYWRFFQKILFRMRSDFYFGPTIDFNSTNATKLNPLMLEDPDVLMDGTLNQNMGFGLTFAYDSRDFALNAYRGVLLDFSFTKFVKFLGGQNDYATIELDLRAYLPIKRERRTLALQFRMRDALGRAPWSEMSMVGSPFDLRGYYWGRFRDEFMAFLIAEYRHMFQRNRPNNKGSLNSPHGFVVWAGIGTVAPSFSFSSGLMPNIGAGYRFEIQPRNNFRFDAGWGLDSFSIYFTFAEAF